MTKSTQSTTPELPPFWDKETVTMSVLTVAVLGSYAVPILLWVADSI